MKTTPTQREQCAKLVDELAGDADTGGTIHKAAVVVSVVPSLIADVLELEQKLAGSRDAHDEEAAIWQGLKEQAEARTVSLEAQLADARSQLAIRYSGMCAVSKLEARNGKLVEALRGWQDFYPDCAQLLDGWHVDTAWTDWDTSVRRSLMRHSLETAEALGDTKTAEVLRAALEDKC